MGLPAAGKPGFIEATTAALPNDLAWGVRSAASVLQHIQLAKMLPQPDKIALGQGAASMRETTDYTVLFTPFELAGKQLRTVTHASMSFLATPAGRVTDRLI